MRPSLVLLLVLSGCTEPSTTEPSPSEEAATSSETEPAPGPSWNVAYRRTSWSLLDAPLSDGETLLFDRTRFDLASGRFLAPQSEELPPAVVLLGADRLLGVVADGLALHDRRSDSALSEAPVPGGPLVASDWTDDRLYAVQERYRGRERHHELLALALPSLRERWRVPLRERAAGEAAGLRLDDGDLVVVVPASCRRGHCEPARLERWTDRDPERRRTVAEGFQRIALDPTGRTALLLGRPSEPERARVIDTHGEELWRLGGLSPESRFGWPQAVALAPGGETAALLETGARGLRLRILERHGSGSVDAFIAPTGPASLSFVGTEAEPTLLVSARGFVALRRGAARPRPSLPYEPAVPTGFRPTELDEDALFGPRRWWEGPGHVSVSAHALEPAELDPELELDAFASRGFRRVAGVGSERLTEPDRAFRVWRDDRGRHAEMVVPACHEGISGADGYHRLTQTEEALVHVAISVPAGTPPEGVRLLLDAFFDRPLGAPESPRELPELPVRSCGI